MVEIMKKLFTIFAPIIAIALICVVAISVYAAVAPEEPENAEKDMSLPDKDQLTEHQLDAISRLESLEKTDDPTRRFPYLEEMASGEVDPEIPKLDLEAVKEIVSNNGKFSMIWEEIKKIQPCPDCIYGSGLTRIEYWFDETGTEKLTIILEQGEVYYESLDSDGSVNTEVLFDPHN